MMQMISRYLSYDALLCERGFQMIIENLMSIVLMQKPLFTTPKAYDGMVIFVVLLLISVGFNVFYIQHWKDKADKIKKETEQMNLHFANEKNVLRHLKKIL